MKEWLEACLEANHLLCSAMLMAVTLVVGLPFILVEESLTALLVLTQRKNNG